MQFFGGHVGKESGSTISLLEMYALLLVQIVVFCYFFWREGRVFTTYACFFLFFFVQPLYIERRYLDSDMNES